MALEDSSLHGSELPLVSIGLPVRNGADLLPRALDSLLGQTEPRLEIIVANNASTDATASVMDRYAAGDARVRVVHHDHNIGMVENFEYVLSAARGRYFMWAAHDDVWQPDFVRSLLTALEADRSVRAAMSATRRIAEDGSPIDEIHLGGEYSVASPWWSLALQVAKGSVHHLYICGLFRTEFLRSLASAFPRVAAGDRLFTLNLVMSARLAYVDDVLYLRQVANQTHAQRYAEEDFGMWWNDPWWIVKTSAKVAPYLLQSKTIPWWRKAFVPIVAAEFFRRRASVLGLTKHVVKLGLQKVRGALVLA